MFGFEIALLVAGLYLAWSLGANNSANIIGTAVGTKTLSFRLGIVFIMFCLGIGILFFSSNVIKTISSGIVDPSIITLPHAVLALLIAAAWVHFATWKKWPVSINQTIVSTVLGIGIAHQVDHALSLIEWGKVISLFGIWLLSPLIGFSAGMIVFRLVHGFVPHKHLYLRDSLRDAVHHPIQTYEQIHSGQLERYERVFRILLILGGGYMALAMGASTIASTTGLIYSGFGDDATVLQWFSGEQPGLLWVKWLVVLGVFLGIVTYGRHLTDFVANKLIKLNPLRGAIIQFTAATVIFVCAQFGYPISTTAVFVGTFLGVDSGEDHPHMKKKAFNEMIHSFFVTIPLVTSISTTAALILEWVLNR